jgi:hypothetical protein
MPLFSPPSSSLLTLPRSPLLSPPRSPLLSPPSSHKYALSISPLLSPPSSLLQAQDERMRRMEGKELLYSPPSFPSTLSLS